MPARRATASSLQPSSWSSAGPGGRFDGDAPDLGDGSPPTSRCTSTSKAQLDLATRDPAERLIGRHLIDAIDEAGYLGESVEEVADRLGAARPRWSGSSP